MRRNLRVLLGTVIGANVLAGAVTMFRLATTSPGSPDRVTLLDCTIILFMAELAIEVAYALCVLQCTRTFANEGDQLNCMSNCLRTFLWLQLAVLVLYVACLFIAGGWF